MRIHRIAAVGLSAVGALLTSVVIAAPPRPSYDFAQAPTNVSPEQLRSPAAQAWLVNLSKRRVQFDALSKRVNALPPGTKQLPMDIACGLMLEGAFANSTTDVGHKIDNDNGRESFHLLVSGGSNEVLDLMYVYSQKGILIASSIQRIPIDWQIMFSNLGSPTDHRMSVLTAPRPSDGGSCTFEFDLFEPFAAKVQ
jgi:hypothetical protein